MAAGVLAFFFNLNLRMRADGSGVMWLEYPASPLMSRESEAHRFGSPGSRLTAFRVYDGRVQVKLKFRHVDDLAASPELRTSTLSMASDTEGTGHFWARLRALGPVDAPVENPASARIRLTVPGSIIQANTDEVVGSTAIWHVPMPRYFSWEGMVLDATFRNALGESQARRGTEDRS